MDLKRLLRSKGLAALQLPGVLALHTGVRRRAGRLTDEPAIVATVEKKSPADALPSGADLTALLGPEQVDVVQASPLKLLFAQPQRFGLGPYALAELEDRFGYPFPAGALVRQSSVQGAAQLLRARRQTSYRPPAGFQLAPCPGPMTLICHASPDAGWKTLKAFLAAIQADFLVGMYDFSAPHIGDAVLARLEAQRAKFRLVLNKGDHLDGGVKKDDRTKQEQLDLLTKGLGADFTWAYAYTGFNGATFFSDYHIKLAVRDRAAFWLSSGNWASSNQPALDPLGADRGDPAINKYDRDWHVVGIQDDLSDLWAKFLEWDLATAEGPRPGAEELSLRLAALDVFVAKAAPPFTYAGFFDPLSVDLDGGLVSPLLTPDNFVEAVTAVVKGAQNSLIVQNQSLTFLKSEADQDPRYTTLTWLLAKKSHDLAEFRLILRDPREFGTDLADAQAIYEAKGFDTSKIRYQSGCHTKGMIADGSTVVVGSHNLTNAGTTANRDSSLIIRDPRVAQYFRAVFDGDWAQAAQDAPSVDMQMAGVNEFAPGGMRRVSLGEILAG